MTRPLPDPSPIPQIPCPAQTNPVELAGGLEPANLLITNQLLYQIELRQRNYPQTLRKFRPQQELSACPRRKKPRHGTQSRLHRAGRV